MRRFLLTLTIALLLLAACDRPVPPQTPTPTSTATPDVTLPPDEPTAEPTPTRESVLNCQTLEFHEDFAPVSNNPCLLGQPVVEELVPSPDGRYQARPPGFYTVMMLPTDGTPFYVNAPGQGDVPPLRRGYTAEIHQVRGQIGYGISGVFLRTRRYIVKLGASYNVSGLPRLIDVRIAGRLIFDTGDIVSLPPQAVQQASDQTEWIYVIENDQELVTVDVELWLDVRFASCTTDAGGCSFTFQQVSVIEAPADFGDDAVLQVP